MFPPSNSSNLPEKLLVSTPRCMQYKKLKHVCSESVTSTSLMLISELISRVFWAETLGWYFTDLPVDTYHSWFLRSKTYESRFFLKADFLRSKTIMNLVSKRIMYTRDFTARIYFKFVNLSFLLLCGLFCLIYILYKYLLVL